MKKTLMDEYYPIRSLEAERIEKMFNDFLRDGLSYGVIASYPDCMVYPSAHTLSILYPEIIQGIIEHKDFSNFITDGALMAIDPTGTGDASFAQRCHELKKLFDDSAVDQICRFIECVEADIPDVNRIKIIKDYWGCALPNPGD